MKKYKIRKWIILISFFSILIGFSYQQNNSIVTHSIEFNSIHVPEDYDGYKILHLSDLHNKRFGREQERLVDKIRKTQPDLIVVTGDIIDARDYNEDISLELFSQIADIAPIYYVSGNHEGKSNRFNEFEERLTENGVVLRNESVILTLNHSNLLLIGVDDPSFNNNISNVLKDMDEVINSHFSILLSHRPELIKTYAEHGIDLVFSGHAHGGQFRIPFIGGFIAPGQGLFPKYTSGIYREGNTSMIVSRGLGNSIIKQRIFNRPEIIIVTLRHK